VLRDETNKTRSHVHMFSKRTLTHHFLNLHRSFVAAESTTWPSKICVSPTNVVSFLSPLWCRISSGRCHNAVTPCHTSFPLNKDEFAASASYFSNVSSCRLPLSSRNQSIESVLPQQATLPGPPNSHPPLL
jgi:hypothetical protein